MIVGIILAAGASARMARPKALLPIGHDTFVTRLVRTLSSAGLDDLVIVAGDDTDAVRSAVTAAGLRARVVENTRRAEGQLSSLLTGLALADRLGVEAALVHLVDIPLVRPATVAAVLEAFRASNAPVVRPAVGNRHGHPVLFARRVFDDLRRADPSAGARSVIRALAGQVLDVAVDDEGACRDFDTPEDYADLPPDASDGGASPPG
ncbi:MAG TPA: nucleotidyltransferase family protein [Vicinamibacterales bacterium]|mgnify:FL=1|nr:nucleotidyltransferase family protein [Vicinamibacterales bacterium]HPK71950.1 nucleotidyltransferase family protein [Vicinamibacterales bacterium]